MMAPETKKRRTAKDYAVLGLKGFCMGAADVVPGVSGGTMAFILGIYQELIASIKSVDAKFFRLLLTARFREAFEVASWQFLAAVATGIFTAIFTVAKVLGWLLETHPAPVWSFFFGLVAASAFVICLEIEKWSVREIAGMAFGAVFAYFLVGLVPATTPETAWFLFLSGAMAICAMILPGISGAFILVLLGKYQYVLNAVNNRDFLTLLIVAAGAAAGLMSFVRLLHWLFGRYKEMTIALLAGLLIGSLRKIWPWKQALAGAAQDVSAKAAVVQANIWPDRVDGEVTLAVGLMLIGAAAVISLELIAGKKKRL